MKPAVHHRSIHAYLICSNVNPIINAFQNISIVTMIMVNIIGQKKHFSLQFKPFEIMTIKITFENFSVVDCTDGSDEANCSFSDCKPEEFRCRNGRCINTIWKCGK